MTIDLDTFWPLIICAAFTTLCTIIGAMCVFFIKKQTKALTSFCTSFAGGIMLAGSFFSLLIPAVQLCPNNSWLKLMHLVGGGLVGFGFMLICEHFFTQNDSTFSPKSTFLAITIHNFPEGMCIGVAFAACMGGGISSAIALAIGIGIQNLPEGASVSLPMYAYCKNRRKAFMYGFWSAITEPGGAIFAYFFSSIIINVLPALLSFAAASMIFVTATDLIPAAITENKKIAMFSMTIGFIFMMLLDIIL